MPQRYREDEQKEARQREPNLNYVDHNSHKRYNKNQNVIRKKKKDKNYKIPKVKQKRISESVGS